MSTREQTFDRDRPRNWWPALGERVHLRPSLRLPSSTGKILAATPSYVIVALEHASLKAKNRMLKMEDVRPVRRRS